MPKVSVVVPVYNGEQNLRECLDSIKNQTLQDIQVICVDDGSTDASLDILREYEQDERFTVLTQQNQYAGAARNAGMEIAEGEYMIFWDCDDFFDLTALEKMYEKAKSADADLCVCGVNQCFDETKEICPWDNCLRRKRVPDAEWFNLDTNTDHILTFVNAAPWNKMYRRAFIEEHGIRFQAVRNGNDVFFNVVAICLAQKIVCVFEHLIIYRRNHGTNLVSTLYKSALTPVNAWIDAAEYLQKAGRFPQKSFANKAVGSMTYLLRNLLHSEEFYRACTYLKENGIEKMGMTTLPKEDWYSENSYEFVRSIQTMTPEEFHRYMAYGAYLNSQRAGGRNAKLKMQKAEAVAKVKKQKALIRELKAGNKDLKAENKKLKEENKQLKEELSRYRNTIIRRILRRIKRFLRR